MNINMKPIPSRTHAVLDYAWAGLVPLLPRFFDCSPATKRLLTGAAMGTLVYSLLTRYELGAIKLLSMQTHLTLDALSALVLIVAPLALSHKAREDRNLILALAIFELAVVIASQTHSSDEQEWSAMPQERSPHHRLSSI